MKRDNFGRFVAGSELGAQAIALGPQRWHLALGLFLRDQPLDVAAIYPVKLALSRRHAALDPGALVDAVGRQALALLVIGADIERDRLAIGNPLAQASDYGGLDPVEIVAAGIVAAARLVQANLGIRQRGKWDVSRLAFDPSVKGAKACGDLLRAGVSGILAS